MSFGNPAQTFVKTMGLKLDTSDCIMAYCGFIHTIGVSCIIIVIRS